MTKQEMLKLETGDVVFHHITKQEYVVTANYGERVTAVKTVDITNETEWGLLAKACYHIVPQK